MKPIPRVSLVIPARNEEHYLPALLDSVDEARARFRHGPDAVEVIVADNASTDRTADIARARNCAVVRVEKRVIAAVRNGGGRAARGEVVAFVDADSWIHPETFDAIDEVMSLEDIVGGATGLKMSRMSAGLAVTYAIMLAFVWTSGLDNGVVFCRRTDFDAIGGYREDKDFAEDVQFLLDLRKLGRGRGQKFARAAAAKAVTSTRKFDRYGDWHYLVNFFRSEYWYFRDKTALHEWGQDYWYRDRE